MANDKDFIVKNAVEVGGSTKVTLGSVTSDVQQTSYDIANASYDSVSFSVASQETFLYDVAFKSDGTKMYAVGHGNDTVYEYNLSTAWDVSTASYSSNSFSVSAQSTQPSSIAFSSDGTKFFIVDKNPPDSVYEYNLSTAWDITTASYSSNSFSVQTQSIDPANIFFKPDGTKFYITDPVYDTVIEYNMGTAYDLTTASYSGNSFSTTTEDATPFSANFNEDGTKMYVAGASTDTVYEYALSTAYSVATASYTGVSFSFATQETVPRNLKFKPDGSKMYLVGDTTDSIYQYSTASYVDQIDLSTGNYFSDTLAANTTYSISNAGDVQSFQLEVTGGAYGPEGAFATTLYTGDGTSSNTVTSNIDLATDGGLLWIKGRSVNTFHILNDTERTLGKCLFTNTTSAESGNAGDLVSNISTTGFTVNVTHLGGSNDSTNKNAATYAAWSFKKQNSFFDVVTYTGNNTNGLQIAHNLGSVPGCIIVKATSGTGDWEVYHRGVDATAPEDYALQLNQSAARQDLANRWNDTAPTSTHFTLGDNGNVNADGFTYVAYLFAHDTSDDSKIKCGSYTGNGSATGPTIDLGWQPQWLLVKNASGTGSWFIVDKERGIVDSAADPYLETDTRNVEFASSDIFDLTSAGFQVTTTSSELNTSGNTHVYIAIRDIADKTITWPSSIEWAGGVAPAAPANGETDVFTITTDDGGTSYVGVKTADNLS